jgi:uncharacterized protein YprB with RNaseH-like and TPR domain
MPSNLRDRLRLIQESLPRTPAARPVAAPPVPLEARAASLGDEWNPVGFMALKRTICKPLDRDRFALFHKKTPPFPVDMGILIPDMLRYTRIAGPPSPADLLLFDLETTGLSGGAGTVAFLAAFGRILTAGGLRLRIDQYLLLDYPGEYDFLETLLREFSVPGSGGKLPLVITYNGKSFDSQILKNRCLMNGLTPPAYSQGDLLHPVRRFWKRVLPSCSQGDVETAILGLDRTGDIPGSQAPEIWFSFLKTGFPGALLRICDHNVRDILGLASLTAVFAEIALDPLSGGQRYCCDPESLALTWWKRSRAAEGETRRKGDALLAAAEVYPRTAYTLALDHFRAARYAEGRRLLLKLCGADAPDTLKAAACRKLAVDAERRLKNIRLSLEYVDSALAFLKNKFTIDKVMIRQRDRLLKKLDGKGGCP